jgi:glutamine synthetase
MIKSKLEYIWLDGYKPTQSLRSKTMVRADFSGNLEDVPMWSFDGSSTLQADGSDSDCLLKPVHIIPDAARRDGFLVMTEVLNADGTPHVSNSRATIETREDDEDFWFGFEQEYFLWDPETNLPPGFPPGGYPPPQGPYYCSVGARNAYCRDLIEEHLDLCLEAGLNVEGINAEVAAGQWEFQVFSKSAKRAGDETWLARYILERTAENYDLAVDWHPKPLGDTDWNGSGMHANFSNAAMRESGKEEVFTKICDEFAKNIERHISVYGADNHHRLTGKHETQSIEQFSYGVSDRGASIRIPIGTVEDGWKGRLEDRRPASNACPYQVAAAIVKTTNEAGV